MKLFSLLLALMMAPAAFAVESDDQIPRHGFTEAQIQEMVDYNAKVNGEEFLNGLIAVPFAVEPTITRRPFADYEKTGYLLFSDSTPFNSAAAKIAMAKYAPSDVTIVIYTQNTNVDYQKRLFNEYAQVVPKERLRVIQLANANNGFWARDGIPIPTFVKDNGDNEKFTVADAKYYFPFEPDLKVSQFFGAGMVSLPYYHEGGNFMANAKGDCIVVNNRRAILIPDEKFKSTFGCTSVLRFPHIKGIGHIDETMKFIDEDTVVTDTPQYVAGLRAAGYEVFTLPEADLAYETYANAVLLNGVAYVPVFGEPDDAEAVRVYESLGFTVYAMNSRILSTQGLGSLHCITMNYPPVPFNELLNHTSAVDVTP